MTAKIKLVRINNKNTTRWRRSKTYSPNGMQEKDRRVRQIKAGQLKIKNWLQQL